jgi:LAO/AO transport system kinase
VQAASASDISTLVSDLTHGSRGALARLLTLAAADRDSKSLTAALNNVSIRSAPVIAFTGSGGVGKSSLLGAVTAHFAERGERIGVLACDPESPITGGALLGDRCRIAGNANSERVFIRSVSTAAGQQAVARNVKLMIDFMKAFGFDRIFLETVGAGQADTAIRAVVDTVVVVLQPQTGDELQWEKAGILEIADVIAVNKSDLPGADRTVADLTEQMHSASGAGVPILKTSIAKREGIDELCQVIESIAASNHGARKLPQHEKPNPLTM